MLKRRIKMKIEKEAEKILKEFSKTLENIPESGRNSLYCR